ncbi:MAG: hypothetical protein ACTSRI_11260 [Promethearchaeota archaeon]
MRDKSIVTIKPNAYLKMLIHVLRFGSKIRDRGQYKEVMGILIGRLEGEEKIKNVIVEDAVPISHGGLIEVAFSPEDYASFAAVDAQYAEKDPPLFSVGWYHSHPALKIFFSSVDIKNQLGWQVPNPSAIGIVFDHTYLETPGDLGFRTFRLDDPSKGLNSDYHEVKTSIVESPDNLNYYIKLMELINSIHSKEPSILEINEIPEIFGAIPIKSQSKINYNKPVLKLAEILQSLQRGISGFLDLSISPLIRYLNNWSQGIIKKIVENNEYLKKDLVSLNDIISNGTLKLQKSYKKDLKEKLDQLDAYIDDKLDDFDNNNENMKKSFIKIKESLIERVNNLIDDKINKFMDNIIPRLNEGSNLITEIKKNSFEQSKSVEQQLSSLKNLSERIKSTESSTLKSLEKTKEKNMDILTERTSNILRIITNIRDKASDSVENIKTAITISESMIQPLQKKMNSLKSDKQDLQDKINHLNNDNEILQNQLKELETQKQNLLIKIRNIEEGGE